jgi:hypothetical protein
MPSGCHLSVFASAVVTGTPAFPLSEIPFQTIVNRVADGTYRAKPAKVFEFADIGDAHRLMESNGARGKIVVRIQTGRCTRLSRRNRGKPKACCKRRWVGPSAEQLVPLELPRQFAT